MPSPRLISNDDIGTAGGVLANRAPQANVFFDDFTRANTSNGSIGTPPTGGAWDLRGTLATAGTKGYISNNRFCGDAGDVIYAVQTLKRPINHMGARFRFVSGPGGAARATLALLACTSNAGAALIANAPLHITVSPTGFSIQYILASSIVTVLSHTFAAELALDTTYSVDIKLNGNVIQYDIAGYEGFVTTRMPSRVGPALYFVAEHYYASASAAELLQIEAVWAGQAPITKPSLTSLCMGHWKFSTTAFTDASGQAHTLTNSNAVTVAAGKIGNGANFVRASSQSLSLANHDDLVLANRDWTIVFWVKPTSANLLVAATQPLISKGTNTAMEYHLYLASDGKVKFGLTPTGSTSTGYVLLSSSIALTADVLNFVTASYNARTGQMLVAVNGGAPASGFVSSVFGGTSPLKFGTSDWFGSFFDGMLDEVAIFSSPPGHGGVLAANDLAALYNDGDGISWPYTA